MTKLTLIGLLTVTNSHDAKPASKRLLDRVKQSGKNVVRGWDLNPGCSTSKSSITALTPKPLNHRCCWILVYFYAYSINDVCFDGAAVNGGSVFENLRPLKVH